MVGLNEVIMPNLEQFLFCDSFEIESILKNYNIVYNRDTHTIKRCGTFINALIHYDRPVSFIQERIKWVIWLSVYTS